VENCSQDIMESRFFGTVKGEVVSIALPTGRLRQKAFAMHVCPGIFQKFKRLQDGIILIVSIFVAVLKGHLKSE